MVVNQQKPYVIGLDLGGTNSVFGIVDQRGEIKVTTAIKTQGHKTVEDYVKASVEVDSLTPEQAFFRITGKKLFSQSSTASVALNTSRLWELVLLMRTSTRAPLNMRPISHGHTIV